MYYYYPRRHKGKSVKWEKQYAGPFLVVDKLGPVNYVIQRSATADKLIVHVNKLELVTGPTPTSWLMSPLRSQDDRRRHEETTQAQAVEVIPLGTNDKEDTHDEATDDVQSLVGARRHLSGNKDEDNTGNHNLGRGRRSRTTPSRLSDFVLY